MWYSGSRDCDFYGILNFRCLRDRERGLIFIKYLLYSEYDVGNFRYLFILFFLEYYYIELFY